MGQFGDKTYESDYIEDLIDDYDLNPDFREDRMLTSLEIREILRDEGDDGEVALGIVSFIIDKYDNHKVLLSPKDLKCALLHAEDLLKDFDYACRWFTNWNGRIEALEEEMKNIHKLLEPLNKFDFSKYDKIDQDSLLDIKNWERFDEDHQFYVIRYLSENPRPEAASILKEDIQKFQNKVGDSVPSRLVLATIALSKIDKEDAINVIFENVSRSFSWVRDAAKEYLTKRLNFETSNQLRVRIEEFIKEL